MRFLVLLLSVCSVSALAGCANNGAIRSLAAQTATAAADYSAATDEFAKTQGALAANDAGRLNNLGVAAREARGEAQWLASAWKLSGDSKKIARFNAATETNAQAILDSLKPTAGAAPVKREKVDLAKPIKTLRQIAVRPTFFDEAQFLRDYAKDVQGELDKLREKAAAEGKKAAAASTAKIPTP